MDKALRIGTRCRYPALAAFFLAACALPAGASAQTVDLSISQTQSADNVFVGDQLSYNVTVGNSGPDTATNYRVTDLLSGSVEYVSGPPFCQPPSASPSGREVQCSPPDISPGLSGSGQIVVRVLEPGSISNHVEVQAGGGQSDSNGANNSHTIVAQAHHRPSQPPPLAPAPPPCSDARWVARLTAPALIAQSGSQQCDGELPLPEAGESVNVRPVSGEVLVKSGGTFVRLEEGQQIPVGSIVDVRKGTVRMTAAANLGGGLAKGDFTGGRFKLGQRRARKPVTELGLRGGSFASCPRNLGRARTAARRIRRLRGNARGRFRMRGRHSSATVRGTRWTMEDRCDGTLTRVQSGRVVVRDFAKRRNIRLRRGQRYLARPRASRR